MHSVRIQHTTTWTARNTSGSYVDTWRLLLYV